MKFLSAVCAVLLLCGASAFAAMPPSHHVVLVVEENHSYSSVIGSPSMPYLNSLANQYGLATHYYANTHPSIGNYFMLTTGQIVTNNDSFTGTINVDDIVKHLQTAGKTWKFKKSLGGLRAEKTEKQKELYDKKNMIAKEKPITLAAMVPIIDSTIAVGHGQIRGATSTKTVPGTPKGWSAA